MRMTQGLMISLTYGVIVSEHLPVLTHLLPLEHVFLSRVHLTERLLRAQIRRVWLWSSPTPLSVVLRQLTKATYHHEAQFAELNDDEKVETDEEGADAT